VWRGISKDVDSFTFPEFFNKNVLLLFRLNRHSSAALCIAEVFVRTARPLLKDLDPRLQSVDKIAFRTGFQIICCKLLMQVKKTLINLFRNFGSEGNLLLGK